MSDLNLDLWQARYREHLAVRRYAAQTTEYYVAELRHFFAYLESHGVYQVVGITSSLVEGYRIHLFYVEYRGQRLSFTTQGHRLAAIKRFTRFLWREHYLLLDPGASVERPRVEHPLPRILLSEADVVALLEAPDTTECLGMRDRALLEVLYSTGVRNAELRQLKLDAVYLADRQLGIRRGKGGKGRVVPLGDTAAIWLGRYLLESRPRLVSNTKEQTVFVSFRGQPLAKYSVVDLVHRMADRAGLSKQVTPHALRLACATHMLARGAGLRHVQDLLGHSSPETTQRYTRIEISDLKNVHRRFHPREQGEGEVPS